MGISALQPACVKPCMDAHPGRGGKPSTNPISAQPQPFPQAGARALPPLHSSQHSGTKLHHALLYPGTKPHVFLVLSAPQRRSQPSHNVMQHDFNTRVSADLPHLLWLGGILMATSLSSPFIASRQ